MAQEPPEATAETAAETADERDARLRARLRGGRFEQCRWVAETGSTNTDLLAYAEGRGTDERLLVADLQTAGRGRRARTWESATSTALMMSVLVHPERDPAHPGEPDPASIHGLHRYTTAMGLAARAGCADVAGVEADLKWPNDLVLGHRKIAGILAESQVQRGRVSAMVVGIGINVVPDPSMSDEVRVRALSLTEAAPGRGPVDRVELAAAIIGRFTEMCARSLADLRDRHLRHSATVGTMVRVELSPDRAAVEGHAVDIDRDGHLIVDTPDGRETLSVGDVTHLRPA